MDNEFEQLEAELKSLPLAAPSAALRERIGRDLAAPRRHGPAPIVWFWAAALPAAAALALGIGTTMRRDLSQPTEPRRSVVVAPGHRPVLKPIAAENVLYSATDEGLVTLADGTRARRERLNYVDTITWTNPRTNASLKWSVPREEIRVVPVSFQ